MICGNVLVARSHYVRNIRMWVYTNHCNVCPKLQCQPLMKSCFAYKVARNIFKTNLHINGIGIYARAREIKFNKRALK